MPSRITQASVPLKDTIHRCECKYRTLLERSGPEKVGLSNSFGFDLVLSKKNKNKNTFGLHKSGDGGCAYLGTGDFRLLDHDEGRGDQGSLSDVVHRVIGHGLQKVDSLLHRKKTQPSLENAEKYTISNGQTKILTVQCIISNFPHCFDWACGASQDCVEFFFHCLDLVTSIRVG